MKSKNSRKARAITRRSIVKHGRLRRSGDRTLPLPKQYRDHYSLSLFYDETFAKSITEAARNLVKGFENIFKWESVLDGRPRH